jgi:hypothetical protein
MPAVSIGVKTEVSSFSGVSKGVGATVSYSCSRAVAIGNVQSSTSSWDPGSLTQIIASNLVPTSQHFLNSPTCKVDLTSISAMN